MLKNHYQHSSHHILLISILLTQQYSRSEQTQMCDMHRSICDHRPTRTVDYSAVHHCSKVWHWRLKQQWFS